MSTLANRPNNSALMSESDNDDDFDQNLSTNQQNEVGFDCIVQFSVHQFTNSFDFFSHRV